jgi:NAD(P)-dependent dehydrogenase (short-subunit alcohol dehydrogenase family)
MKMDLTVAVKLAIHFFRKLQKKGVIVMISSTAGYMGEPIPGYSTAKHGVCQRHRRLTLSDRRHHEKYP